jgi:hypothetical protein
MAGRLNAAGKKIRASPANAKRDVRAVKPSAQPKCAGSATGSPEECHVRGRPEHWAGIPAHRSTAP